MVRHYAALFVLSLVAAIAARGTEVPLGPPTDGPAYPYLLGATARGSGFLLITRTSSGHEDHVWGTRISASGESDAHSTLLFSRESSGYNPTVRTEDGSVYLERVTVRYDAAARLYERERLTLDVENVRVASSETSVLPGWPRYFPKNERGETVEVTSQPESGVPLLWFVGADGIRRKPTPLAGWSGVSEAMPVGDEWVIVGSSSGSLIWCRISEAKRDTPATMNLGPYPFRMWFGQQDGELVIVADERVWQPRGASERKVTLRLIRADGSTVKHILFTDHLSESDQPRPDVAVVKDGDHWLIAHPYSKDYDAKRELRLWRATFAGAVLTNPVNDGHDVAMPLLVSGATHNLLVFMKTAWFRDRDAFAPHAFVWPRGSAIPPGTAPRVVASEAPRQTLPRAVASTAGTMTAWIENENAYARFFPSSGTAPDPVQISSPYFNAGRAAVTRNGDTILVMWNEASLFRGRVLLLRFDSAGAQLDREPVVLWDLVTGPTGWVAATAESDGFRVAFTARSLPAMNNNDPEPSVFTTHISTRGSQFAEPTPVTSGNVRANNPLLISDGSDSLLIWAQTSDDSSQAIHAQRFMDGVARGATFRLTSGWAYAVAAHRREFLLVSTEPDLKNGTCTRTQRYAFDGAALAAPATLACSEGGAAGKTRPSAIWDNGSWWVSPLAPRVTHVYQLHADGTTARTWRFFADAFPAMEMHLVATGTGPSVVYVRVDPKEEMVERAFLRTFPWPKTRAVRP